MSIAQIYQYPTTYQSRLRLLAQDILAIDAPGMGQAANQAAALVCEATGARIVTILLHDATSGQLHRIGGAGATSDVHTPTSEAALDVFRTGNPHVANHPDGDGGKAGNAAVILPLMVGGERRGVVEIVSDTRELLKSYSNAETKAAVHSIGVLVKRAERTARLVEEAAQDARYALIEDLTSTLNHDLRNMMAPIAGRLDLIRRQANREGHEKYVRHAEEATNATKRMQAVLQNLVDVARLEQGTLPLMQQDIALADLVRMITGNMHTSDDNARIDVRDDVHTVGDLPRIQQTLEFLINNALRYSPAEESVAITIMRDERDGKAWARIAICDQGTRISSDMLPQVFARWTIGRGSCGFNLGLYLAQGVAKAHGGTLEAASDEQHGTTWTLVLPAAS